MINKFKDLCDYKMLSDKFFTIGQVLGRAWRGEVTFTIPDPILMHHAAGDLRYETKGQITGFCKTTV